MNRIFRSSIAKADLLEIWDYIAIEKSHPLAADRLLRRIDAVLSKICEHPEIGERYTRSSVEVRIFPVGSYLLIYRQVAKGIELLRVLHGAQRWENLL